MTGELESVRINLGIDIFGKFVSYVNIFDLRAEQLFEKPHTDPFEHAPI